jgi:hypothetical protein
MEQDMRRSIDQLIDKIDALIILRKLKPGRASDEYRTAVADALYDFVVVLKGVISTID